MASSIDATKPTAGAALTADVRNNFSAAKTEIEALQAAVASALVAKAGDTMTGTLTTSVGTFASTVADGASAVGFDFSTSSYTTAGALVARLRNNATTVFSVDKDGAGFIRKNLTIGTAGAANGISFPGSGHTSTLTVNAFGDALQHNGTIQSNGLQANNNGFLARGGGIGFQAGSLHFYGFSNSSDGAGTQDTRMYRGAAGRIDVCTTSNANYGDVKLRSLISSGGLLTLSTYTVATRPTEANSANSMVVFTDATAIPTRGGTFTGGGSTKWPGFCDGSTWMAL